MGFWARLYFKYFRVVKAITLFVLISGLGIVVLLADNDAGGLTAYVAIELQYGHDLVWFLVTLPLVVYCVLKMVLWHEVVFYKELMLSRHKLPNKDSLICK